MLRIGPPNALEGGLGRFGLLLHAPLNHRDLNEDPNFFVRLDPALAELPFVDSDQAIPLGRRCIGFGQIGDGLFISGRDRERPLERLHRTLRGPAPKALGTAEPKRGRKTRGLVGPVLHERGLRGGKRVPILGGRRSNLGEPCGAHVLRIDAQRLGKLCGSLSQPRLFSAEAERKVSGPRERSALQGRLFGCLRVSDVAVDELTPLLGLLAKVLQPFERMLVLGSEND